MGITYAKMGMTYAKMGMTYAKMGITYAKMGITCYAPTINKGLGKQRLLYNGFPGGADEPLV